MWIIPIGIGLGLAIAFFADRLGKPKRTVTGAGGFESTSQARAYYLAQAARIAREGNALAIDSALSAMRALALESTAEYALLAAAAAASNPLVDPFA